MKKIQSTCNYCALDCNMDFYGGRAIVKSAAHQRVIRSTTVSAASKGPVPGQSSRPWSRPLRCRRSGGRYHEGSVLGEGFSHVADKLKELQEKYGKERGGHQHGPADHGGIRHFRPCDASNYLKTNVDGNTRLCMAPPWWPHKQSYGFDAPGYTLKDLELSDTIVFIGANPVVAHPILWRG